MTCQEEHHTCAVELDVVRVSDDAQRALDAAILRT